MNFKITSLLLLLIPTLCVGQIKVSGTVNTKDNEPIPFVNLLVLQASDSSFVKGELIYNGELNVSLNKGSYLLNFKVTGFEDTLIPVNQSTNLGTIIMNERILDAVVIKSQQTPFESQQGNLKINVENSLFSNSSSISEVLTKSPGVSINDNGISVVGRGDALVYIDGKLSTVDAMKATPVSMIKSVEIVKNPDASYDAMGKAVILVTLKELGLEGFQGSIYGNYTKAFFHLGYFDANLNWRKGKWSLMASANLNIGATGAKRLDDFNIPNASTPFTANSDYFEKVYLNHVTNYLFGVKRTFNDKHSVSAQFNGNYSDYTLDVRTNIFQQLEDSLHANQNHNVGISVWQNQTLSGNYTVNLDSLGSKLFLGTNYSIVSRDYLDTIVENHSSGESSYQSNSVSSGINTNDLWVSQLDYNKNFKNGSLLKAGAKYTLAGTNSDIDLITINSSEVINDIHRNIDYQEHLLAGYINWNGNMKKMNYQLGVRAEHITASATEQSLGQYLDTSYLSVFPNASIDFEVGNWRMTDQFNSKITRPGYAEVTPYIYYLGSFATVQGNPNLQPEFNHNLEHKFTHKELGTNISLGVNHTKNARVFIPIQNQTGASTITYTAYNLNQKNEAYIEVAQGIDKKFLSGYTMVNVSVVSTEDDIYQVENFRSIPKVYCYSYNRIPVKELFNLELIGSFTSSFWDGSEMRKPEGEFGFGFSKSLDNNKWFVQVSVNDLFQTAKKRGAVSLLGNQYEYATTIDSRFLRVAVSYNFGKLKETNFNHQNISENELQRAK